MSASKAVNRSPFYASQLRKFAAVTLVTMIAALCAVGLLLPIANSVVDALTKRACSSNMECFFEPETYTYQGQSYPIFNVPLLDGTVKQWALVHPRRNNSDFVDPANPDAGLITWIGRWRGLDPVSEPVWPHPEYFSRAWQALDFPLLFRNTLFIAILGMIGTLLSSICVAYAFARFPIPGKNILFLILISSVIIVPQITIAPLYAMFARIGWTGTWLPLIVPAFFANAISVFLLRQHFMTLPRQLDEAAIADGASPLQILTKVIIPQSWSVIAFVGIFYFVFAWNDYFSPLVYLFGHTDLQPLSVGVQLFNFTFDYHPELVQATSLMMLAVPVLIFVLAHPLFIRGARLIKDGFARGLGV